MSGSKSVIVVCWRRGVLFQINPACMELQQTVSTFGQTTSGVNGSPTFLKRELSTSISLQSGEAALLGGLNESRATSDGRKVGPCLNVVICKPA